jgi:hypothetical protein
MTESQDTLAASLMGDEPKIDTAIKNHLAKVFAESLTTEKADAGNAGASAADEPQPLIDTTTYRKLAGVLLREVNAHTLPPVTEWGAKNPQGETQTGMARMQQLGDYKVYHMLLQRVLSNSEKATKFFGRQFLQFLFADIRSSLLTGPESATKCRGVPTDTVKLYLDEIETSFDIKNDLGELVWATDFNATLRERHARRKKEAEERLARAAEAQTKAEQEQDPLTKQVLEAVREQDGVGLVGSGSGSSSWIEEVDESEREERKEVEELKEEPEVPIDFPPFQLPPRREYDIKSLRVGDGLLQSVYYIPDFITEEEEAAMQQQIYTGGHPCTRTHTLALALSRHSHPLATRTRTHSLIRTHSHPLAPTRSFALLPCPHPSHDPCASPLALPCPCPCLLPCPCLPPLPCPCPCPVPENHPRWTTLRTRRLQRWGGDPDTGPNPDEPLPEWLELLSQRLVDAKVLVGSGQEDRKPNHALLNEYGPGQVGQKHVHTPHQHTRCHTSSQYASTPHSWTHAPHAAYTPLCMH